MVGWIIGACGWTLPSRIHSAEPRSEQALGMGLFCSPGTAGAVPAVWPQRSSQHVTEEHVVELGDFIILRLRCYGNPLQIPDQIKLFVRIPVTLIFSKSYLFYAFEATMQPSAIRQSSGFKARRAEDEWFAPDQAVL